MRWSQSDDVGSRSNNRRAETDVESSRTNADDRLPLASLGRVEGGDGFVEGRDVADVRPSRARRTISLSWARSGTTTKSTVRPSAGRASVGPAMVTSVPRLESRAR